jgi:hypothetical protein
MDRPGEERYGAGIFPVLIFGERCGGVYDKRCCLGTVVLMLVPK